MTKFTKTNPKLIKIIERLKDKSYKEKAAIWKDVAKRIETSTRRKAQVNISKINRYSDDDEIILIPGKVLGSGSLDHKVKVAALDFSNTAEEKIKAAGGKCMDIFDIMDKNPKGSKIRIIE
ncbi:MAG: 50S ribosomal protein L18e [Euryarchaeota archaeon]|nr:50S ribosomal protein L18e [Euryarchaeota archaeon]